MALVTQHDRGILRLALHTLGDPEEAKEAYQETYLKAYRSVTRFRSESSFYTWVYRIATNVCYDHLRKQKKKREELSMETSAFSHDGLALQDRLADDSHYVDPERVLYGQEVGQKIQQALKTLTEKERLVFELRHYRNMKLKVIGQILGIPEGTVKNRLFQGTQKLRTRLSELGNGGETSKPGRGAAPSTRATRSLVPHGSAPTELKEGSCAVQGF